METVKPEQGKTYRRLDRLKKKTVSLFILALLAMFTIVIKGAPSSYPKPEIKAGDGMSRAYSLPKELSFAEEKVPLHLYDVAERFDREMHINIYWQSNTLLSIKRAARYFPLIISILKKNNIPEDFKYLPLIESSFLHVVSPAGAEGFWQFMPETGRRYGLEINKEIDERYHLEKATDAACKYLRDAYGYFGNWTMAAASYNMGYAGLQVVKNFQKEDNYYDLDLNEQTGRYIFRLLAIKEVMEHPAKYNFSYSASQLYKPYPTVKIPVDSPLKNLVDFAKVHNSNLKLIKICNPWLKKNFITNKDGKKYLIEIPLDKNTSLFDVDEESTGDNIPLKNNMPDSVTGKKNNMQKKQN